MDSILRPVMRPVLQPILRSVFDPAIGGGTPSLADQVQALFGKYSAAGGMWDFTNTATLFQDSAGTTPVTASGQSIGRVLDISGGSNTLIQYTAANRPLFNPTTGATFDGVNDSFVTAANLDLSACDKVVVGAGYVKVDDGINMVLELGINGSGVGKFYLLNGLDSGQHSGFQFPGSASVSLNNSAFFSTARPNTYLSHIARGSIPGDLAEVWANGVKGVDSNSDRIAGTMESNKLYIGARNQADLLFNSTMARAIVLAVPVAGSQVSDDDLAIIDAWLAEVAP